VSNDLEIAVIGAGCRFPDAWTPQQLWSNIDDGLVSMRELSDEQLRASGVSSETLRSPDYVRVGTTLPGVADFAAEFFGYSPREARAMDPQQRIFLEACWEALESAGHPPAPDGPLVGVFAGSAAGTYSAARFALAVNRMGLAGAVDDLELTIGGEPDFLTSRVAYKLGLRGPAVSVQAACSSSLYAMHFASLSLLSGECDLALAGGATVLEPVRGYRYRPDEGQSEDGYNRSFDAKASGTAYSSGVGVVALRRLADALADGDPILAVLRGTAVGNDGAQKAGFAAPSPAGVADVVAAALRVSGVPAELLRYVEAHGTATPLGDHVELSALTEALRATTTAVGFCGLGSVKANIGHTGAAASIAGFLKAVHIARTGVLPPHPTFERPRDPGILAESPFFITTTARTCTDTDRHVLVNSIGFGGGNAAAVLAPPPAPVRAAASPAGERVRLVVSARNRIELDAASRALADAIDRGDLPVSDVSHTLRVGRQSFDERRVVSAAPDRLAAALRLPRPPLAQTWRSSPRRAVIVVPDGTGPPLALLEELRSALPGGTPVVADPAPYASSAEWFRIELGDGDDGPDRHALALDGGPADHHDRLDAAVTAAWLHGVEVDWDRLAKGRGRRVPLPTYPFSRKRHWALDGVDLSELSIPRASCAAASPAAAAQPAAAAGGDNGNADPVERDVLAIWREVLGNQAIGLDDEFGRLGGTSLLSVQLVLELQDRFGVLVNLHRAGGGGATARRMAALLRGLLAEPGREQPRADRMDLDDNGLVDADLQLPLGRLAAAQAPGRDVLLTGATGFLGSFLLHELLRVTTGRIYCLVRAADEAAALARLRAAAERFLLPEPDATRVRAVPGDLREIARLGATYRDGELERQVGHVLHCAAKVVFTEPYRELREDNVLPLAELLAWMRGCGIRDLSFVSTAAATAPAMGSDRVLETRDQPLEPRLSGYGVSKWVGERLLDRADQDGMRVRVFRPGLIMPATTTGASNPKDLIGFVLASGVAVGAHPIDDRSHDLAPVDVVAAAIAELAMSRGSVGRVYHLVGEKLFGLRELFAMLAGAGLPTRPVELERWQELVRQRALATGNPILSTAALFEIEGYEEGDPPLQATAWQPWLRRKGINPEVTGEMLYQGLRQLARGNELFGSLLPDLIDRTAVVGAVEGR
jgi:phthiocerol/phenolphthiocerol synthesis type-I polyketide synthase E